MKKLLIISLLLISYTASAQTPSIEAGGFNDAESINIDYLQAGVQFDLDVIRINTGAVLYNTTEDKIGLSTSIDVPYNSLYASIGVKTIGRGVQDLQMMYELGAGINLGKIDVFSAYVNYNSVWYVRPVSIRYKF